MAECEQFTCTADVGSWDTLIYYRKVLSKIRVSVLIRQTHALKVPNNLVM